jgi:hypothetical protein
MYMHACIYVYVGWIKKGEGSNVGIMASFRKLKGPPPPIIPRLMPYILHGTHNHVPTVVHVRPFLGGGGGKGEKYSWIILYCLLQTFQEVRERQESAITVRYAC